MVVVSVPRCYFTYSTGRNNIAALVLWLIKSRLAWKSSQGKGRYSTLHTVLNTNKEHHSLPSLAFHQQTKWSDLCLYLGILWDCDTYNAQIDTIIVLLTGYKKKVWLQSGKRKKKIKIKIPLSKSLSMWLLVSTNTDRRHTRLQIKSFLHNLLIDLVTQLGDSVSFVLFCFGFIFLHISVRVIADGGWVILVQSSH